MSMPDRLQVIVDAFQSAPKPLGLQLLLEYSRKVPPLPDQLAGHRERMEQVHECQTPFFTAGCTMIESAMRNIIPGTGSFRTHLRLPMVHLA